MDNDTYIKFSLKFIAVEYLYYLVNNFTFHRTLWKSQVGVTSKFMRS